MSSGSNSMWRSTAPPRGLGGVFQWKFFAELTEGDLGIGSHW